MKIFLILLFPIFCCAQLQKYKPIFVQATTKDTIVLGNDVVVTDLETYEWEVVKRSPQKGPYRYILQFVDDYELINNISYFTQNAGETIDGEGNILSKGFHYLSDVLDYLNNSQVVYIESDRRNVWLDSSKILSLYDLKKGKELNLVLKSKKQRREKRVVIEAEEWTDKWYEVEN